MVILVRVGEEYGVHSRAVMEILPYASDRREYAALPQPRRRFAAEVDLELLAGVFGVYEREAEVYEDAGFSGLNLDAGAADFFSDFVNWNQKNIYFCALFDLIRN